MGITFLLWWELHVITILYLEEGIGIVRRSQGESVERDVFCRTDYVFVKDAVIRIDRARPSFARVIRVEGVVHSGLQIFHLPRSGNGAVQDSADKHYKRPRRDVRGDLGVCEVL